MCVPYRGWVGALPVYEYVCAVLVSPQPLVAIGALEQLALHHHIVCQQTHLSPAGTCISSMHVVYVIACVC